MNADGTCPSGWSKVDAPTPFCADGLSDAQAECKKRFESDYNMKSAVMYTYGEDGEDENAVYICSH